MVVGKIAGPLERVMEEQPFHPVIIKLRYNKPWQVDEFFQEIVQYDMATPGINMGTFLNPVIPFVTPLKMPSFGMVAVTLDKDMIYRYAEDSRVEKIYRDAPMRVYTYSFYSSQNIYGSVYGTYGKIPEDGIYTLGKHTFTSTYWTKRYIGADIANAKGFTGLGIKFAVPDTGVALHHIQLGWRTEFKTAMPMQRVDGNGHGTWCMTCIHGSKAVDHYLSQRVHKQVICEGMAPKAEGLAVKCLGYLVGTGSTSQVAKAMEIAMNWGAEVVSMSLGGKEDAETPEDDPYYPILQKYLEKNIIPVIAAGNSGPKEGTVGSPGALPQPLTVGAWDPINDTLADFSSRGPTPWGDTKPDVVAPGVNIDSGTTGMLDMTFDHVESRFTPLSGTSMATPHAAGLCILMRQAHKKVLGKVLTVDEVKDMMEAWAKNQGHEKDNYVGWGLIHWQIYEWWLETQYGVKI